MERFSNQKKSRLHAEIMESRFPPPSPPKKKVFTWNYGESIFHTDTRTHRHTRARTRTHNNLLHMQIWRVDFPSKKNPTCLFHMEIKLWRVDFPTIKDTTHKKNHEKSLLQRTGVGPPPPPPPSLSLENRISTAVPVAREMELTSGSWQTDVHFGTETRAEWLRYQSPDRSRS